MPVDDLNGIYIQETEANAIAMRMRVLGEEADAIHLDAGKKGIMYTGTVRKASVEMKEETTGILMDYYEWIAEMSDDWELTDEDRASIREAVPDVYVEIYSSDAALRIPICQTFRSISSV